MKLLIYVFVFLFTACTGLINLEQEAPVIVRSVTDIAIVQDSSLLLTLEYVETYDINGDNISLVVLEGDNYTVEGAVIRPAFGFTGDLFVAIAVKDETGLQSEPKLIIVSVLPDTREIVPLYNGAEWLFADTFFTIDSTTSSRLSVTGAYDGAIPGISGEVFTMKWHNLDSLNLEYLYHSSDSGAVRCGGIAPGDLYVDPVLELKYPVSPGDSWQFSPMDYDTLTGKYYTESAVSQLTCIDTSRYTTVPAGIFKCTVYEYEFDYEESSYSRSEQSMSVRQFGVSFRAIPEMRSRAAGDNMVKVQLFYAEGVGYVQNLTYLNNQLVSKKALVDYTVEERL